MGRVSTNSIYRQAYTSVANSREREAKTAEKVATQKEIVRPSDDPQGWRFAKEARDEGAIRETLNRNGNMAMSFLEATENVLTNIQEFVTRAYELTIGGIDNIRQESETAGIREELVHTRDAVLQMANLRYGNRTLLGGFKTHGEAFDQKGQFKGDGGVIEVEVERGRHFAVNVNGEQAILGKDRKHGINIIKAFDDVIRGFEEQNFDLVNEQIMTLKGGVEQLSLYRSQIGSRMGGMEVAMNTNSEHKIDLEDVASSVEEIDVAKVFSELARDKTALEATIRAAETMIKEVPADMLFRK